MNSKRSKLAWLVSKAPDGFKGVSRCFGGDLGLKGAENGLEQLEIDGELADSPILVRVLGSLVRLQNHLEWLRSSTEL
jgi:hypothetical protein